jgi:hypothetical protein
MYLHFSVYHDTIWYLQSMYHDTVWYLQSMYHDTMWYLQSMYHDTVWYLQSMYHDTVWYLQSMYHLGSVCILCHRLCHLQSCYNLKQQPCTGHHKEQEREETDIQVGRQ